MVNVSTSVNIKIDIGPSGTSTMTQVWDVNVYASAQYFHTI